MTAPRVNLSANRKRDVAFAFAAMPEPQRVEMVGWLYDAGIIDPDTLVNYATAAMLLEAFYTGGIRAFVKDTASLASV